MTVDIADFQAPPVEDLPDGLDFGNEVDDPDSVDHRGPVNAPEGDSHEQDIVDAVELEGDGETDDDEGVDDQDDDPTNEGEVNDGGEQDEPEPEPKAPKKSKGKEPFVPKARMDQALRKARAAEQQAQELAARLAELEAERAQANAPKPLSAEEIQARMAEANEALVAGDTTKAAQIQAELMATLTARPEAPKPTPAPERDVVAEVEERLAFKQTLKEIYSRFPQLDENGDQFDEDLGEEAVDLQRAYLNRGFSLSEATRKAAEAVAKIHDLEDQMAQPELPAVKVAATKAKQAARTKAKLEKATKAAPKLAGNRGEDNEVQFDIFNATEEEFMALPKAVQDRLLGNVL